LIDNQGDDANASTFRFAIRIDSIRFT